jgi:hypothetical protein
MRDATNTPPASFCAPRHRLQFQLVAVQCRSSISRSPHHALGLEPAPYLTPSLPSCVARARHLRLSPCRCPAAARLRASVVGCHLVRIFPQQVLTLPSRHGWLFACARFFRLFSWCVASCQPESSFVWFSCPLAGFQLAVIPEPCLRPMTVLPSKCLTKCLHLFWPPFDLSSDPFHLHDAIVGPGNYYFTDKFYIRRSLLRLHRLLEQQDGGNATTFATTTSFQSGDHSPTKL